MNRLIAFLRAINVTNRFVKMDILRQQIEQLGFSQVQTYIQSGNVIFETSSTDCAELERKIEERLQEALGFQVPTLVRTAPEMAEIAQYQPFAEEKYGDKSVLYISFLKEEPGQDQQRQLVELSSANDEFHVYERQVYWLMHKDQGQSKFTNNKLEKILKVPATRRNTSTVRKIAAKYFGDE